MLMKRESFPFGQLAHFVKEGLLGDLEWVSSCSKRRYRSLFWRMRAAVKKALKSGGKQQLKFQYDPSSYALNFDDGSHHTRDGAEKFIGNAGAMELKHTNNTTRAYVLWVKTR